MKYIATGDKIFVQESKKPEVIATYEGDSPTRIVRAKVLSTGKDVEEICDGDIVYFGLGNAKTLTLEEEIYYVIKEEMIALKEKNNE